MKRGFKENGITLVALVVTIIVLLVLAGLTISLALNKNGIIERSKLAASKYSDAADKEQADLEEINSKVNNITTESEISKLTIGTALDAADYGKKVSYAGNTTEWRLFYKDSNYAYIIHNSTVSLSGDLDSLGSTYTNGASVSEVGKKLNSSIQEAFTTTNTNTKIKAVAYLTDTNVWNKTYKKGDAIFAIASPSIELFCKSYNAVQSANNVNLVVDPDKTGYWYSYGNSIATTENGGLYNNGTAYWLSSPYDYNAMIYLASNGALSNAATSYEYAVRPVVCIPAASLQLAE